MHTQLNGLVNCSRYLSGMACAIALLLLSIQPALSETKPDGTSGGSGPDVVGLRLGMTAAEARAIFKSRILVSDHLRLNYQEIKGTLSFLLPNFSPQPVSNSDFISIMGTQGKGKDELMRSVIVSLTPVPGHEEIVTVYRIEPIEASKKITFGAFEKLLVDKYGGPPTYTGPGAPQMHFWIYDKNGSLLKPGTKSFTAECSTFERNFESTNSNVVLAYDTHSKLTGAPSFSQLAGQCGATFLYLIMNLDGGNAGPNTLVNSYQTHLIGFDVASRASTDSNAIIDKARADASAAAIKKGQQQRPDF
jgi:hypothetical protein